MPTIGILIGSNRINGNFAGLLAWLTPLVGQAASQCNIVPLDPYNAPIALPLFRAPVIPQGVKDPSEYASPATQLWGKAVAACDGFVILTPQYNRSIPGPLKNAIDHLFWEFVGKPVVFVTYGGHGGAKCAAHLRDVCDGLKMKVVGGVEITLDDDYIRRDLRVGKQEDPWLAAYEESVLSETAKLMEAMSSQKCIVFYADHELSDHSLILAANRDESLARATATATWHDFSSPANAASASSSSRRILSGLDLEAGGTWFGISLPPTMISESKLRFSMLTNYTETLAPTSPPRPSRGNLVKDFLEWTDEASSLDSYLKKVDATKAAFAGFNLLLGELLPSGEWRMGYASNRELEGSLARIVGPQEGNGVKGLSNDTLVLDGEGRWPKVKAGSEAFAEVLKKERSLDENELVQSLWGVLSTASPEPITERVHLRQTVLVRPTFQDPKAPLPFPLPTFTPSAHSSSLARLPEDLPPPSEMKAEGDGGNVWYGTRLQSALLISKLPRSDGKLEAVFWERDAYELGPDRKPRWSGQERRFVLYV